LEVLLLEAKKKEEKFFLTKISKNYFPKYFNNILPLKVYFLRFITPQTPILIFHSSIKDKNFSFFL